ncbi:MAG: type II toxin-antitoxin system VapC family toxin [Bacteroidia bacterium]
MRYLIDTNILIFAISDKDCLSKNIQSILNEYDSDLFISSSSIFELLHLFQNGRISTKIKTAKDFLLTIEKDFNLKVLHSKKEHFDTFAKLPIIKGHNDPIDRIIISQSITEKIPLISSDGKFKEYKTLDFIYNDKKAR